MIFCCGCYFNKDKEGKGNRNVNLFDSAKYKNRVLEIGICPKCGTLKAYIRQYRIKDNKYVEKKPAKVKYTAEFIRRYEKEPYLEFENKCPTHGVKSNMHWLWFDGAIDFWARDFNGTKQFELNNDFETRI